MRKLWAITKEIGLSDEERHSLTEWVLKTDEVSWRELDTEQVCRLIDSLEGFLFVTAIMMMREN